MRVPSLGWEDFLEKEIGIHSSILAWEIPQTVEPGGLRSTRSQRARYNLATKQSDGGTGYTLGVHSKHVTCLGEDQNDREVIPEVNLKRSYPGRRIWLQGVCVCVCVVEGGKCTEWETVRCSRGWGVWKLEGRRPTQGIISCWKWLRVWCDGEMLRDDVRGVGREQTFQRTLCSKTESKSYSKATESYQKVLKQSDRHTFHTRPSTFESTC